MAQAILHFVQSGEPEAPRSRSVPLVINPTLSTITDTQGDEAMRSHFISAASRRFFFDGVKSDFLSTKPTNRGIPQQVVLEDDCDKESLTDCSENYEHVHASRVCTLPTRNSQHTLDYSSDESNKDLHVTQLGRSLADDMGDSVPTTNRNHSLLVDPDCETMDYSTDGSDFNPDTVNSSGYTTVFESLANCGALMSLNGWRPARREFIKHYKAQCGDESCQTEDSGDFSALFSREVRNEHPKKNLVSEIKADVIDTVQDLAREGSNVVRKLLR